MFSVACAVSQPLSVRSAAPSARGAICTTSQPQRPKRAAADAARNWLGSPAQLSWSACAWLPMVQFVRWHRRACGACRRRAMSSRWAIRASHFAPARRSRFQGSCEVAAGTHQLRPGLSIQRVRKAIWRRERARSVQGQPVLELGRARVVARRDPSWHAASPLMSGSLRAPRIAGVPLHAGPPETRRPYRRTLLVAPVPTRCGTPGRVGDPVELRPAPSPLLPPSSAANPMVHL
eukprot:tig00000076_g2327.t1